MPFLSHLTPCSGMHSKVAVLARLLFNALHLRKMSKRVMTPSKEVKAEGLTTFVYEYGKSSEGLTCSM